MAGTAVNSPIVIGGTGQPSPVVSPLTASTCNAFRISAVADKLAAYTSSNNDEPNNNTVFFNLCLSLARGIDFAIANDEVPEKAPELPSILKQACQRKSDPLLLAGIMVLMISIKNACKRKWFSDKDSEILQAIVKEVATHFSSDVDNNTEPSSHLSTISTIMSRFYPRMQMGKILAFLEVKSGFGAHVLDFHISKDVKSHPQEKIRLFVAQTDNTETSSCIISPSNVNFLLNGKGVDRRTNVQVDNGPQIPTVVTPMLKFGTNLLQALGQFNGNYIIAVAYMSVISNPITPPALEAYVQPGVASLDSEIEEGPFRISLNCPISFSRIKNPVKGHLCKHLQCFDFENFVDINSRRPSWRCPHCNQNVCYRDIRSDQNMVKVLKEVGESVTDVIISADGSWKAVMDTEESSEKQNQKDTILEHDEQNPKPNSTSNSNANMSDIMDLTVEDDPVDVVNSAVTQDKKPIVNLQNQPSQTGNLRDMFANNPPPTQLTGVNDDFWSEMFLPISNTDSQTSGGISESTPATTSNMSQSSVPNSYPNLTQQIQQNYMPQQQHQQLRQLNSNVNEYGTGVSRQVTRTPVAVQALAMSTQQPHLQPPLQQRPSPQQRPPPQQRQPPQQRPAHSIGDGLNHRGGYGHGGANQSRAQALHNQVSQMNVTAIQQLMGSQVGFRQDHQPQPMQQQTRQQQSFMTSPPPPPPPPPSQPPIIGGLRASSQIPNRVGPYSEPTRMQPLHLRSQSPALMRAQPAHMQRSHVHPQGGSASGFPNSSPNPLSSQHMHMSAPPSQGQSWGQGQQRPMYQTNRTQSPLGMSAERFRSNNMGNTQQQQQQQQQSTSTADVASELNWRPTGRMRGSLSGQAYSEAFNQFIASPTQPFRPLSPNLGANTSNTPSTAKEVTNVVPGSGQG